MKLYKLLDAIDYNRESTREKLQICRPDSDWDEYDEVLTSSSLLLPFYELEVEEIEAIDEDVIRVSLEWDEKWYNWGKKPERRSDKITLKDALEYAVWQIVAVGEPERKIEVTMTYQELQEIYRLMKPERNDE